MEEGNYGHPGNEGREHKRAYVGERPCESFRLWRLCGIAPSPVGAAGVPRVLVWIEGAGQIQCRGDRYEARRGGAVRLPVVLGACVFHALGIVNVPEIGIPV